MTTEEKFISVMAEKAIGICKQSNLLLSLCIAQACLESAYGASELAVNANNLFGIKKGGGWTGKVYYKQTKEWNGTEYITIYAPFRSYDTMEDCIRDYAAKLTGMPRYQNLIGCTDINLACRYIREDGWATSPTYTENLLKVVEKYDLTQYDSVDPVPDDFEEFLVKIICRSLCVRNGPGIMHKINNLVFRGDVFSIVEVNGKWGKLKSGAGWINISDRYCEEL